MISLNTLLEELLIMKYNIDFMAHVGQHPLSARHPHFQAIYNNPPKDVEFNFIEKTDGTNPQYDEYLRALTKTAKEIGCSDESINYFISKIHPNCRNHPETNLCFVPSLPYFGPESSMWNLEDWNNIGTFLMQGHTAYEDVDNKEWKKVMIAAWLQPSFKYLAVHMHDTVKTLKFLARGFPEVQDKFIYLPIGSTQSEEVKQPRAYDGRINVLFTNSYGGQLSNFFVRGGPAAIQAMATIIDKYPNVYFTTIGPCHRINHPNVTQLGLGGVIPDEEFNKVIDETHILLIPAKRVHSINIVTAHCNGIVPVTSDGWGFDEFVDNGYNGLIVEGEHGYSTWKDKDDIFLEDYDKPSSPDFVSSIEQTILGLVNEPGRIEEMSKNCLEYASKSYSIDKRNRILLKMIEESYVG